MLIYITRAEFTNKVKHSFTKLGDTCEIRIYERNNAVVTAIYSILTELTDRSLGVRSKNVICNVLHSFLKENCKVRHKC